MTPRSAESEVVPGLWATAAPETEAFDIINTQQMVLTKANKKHRLLLCKENLDRIRVVIILFLRSVQIYSW